MAVVGYTEKGLKDLMERAVADLPFKGKSIEGRIVGKLEELGIFKIGQLLQAPKELITGTKGFGREMEMELFAALKRISIYPDGEEP